MFLLQLFIEFSSVFKTFCKHLLCSFHRSSLSNTTLWWLPLTFFFSWLPSSSLRSSHSHTSQSCPFSFCAAQHVQSVSVSDSPHLLLLYGCAALFVFASQKMFALGTSWSTCEAYSFSSFLHSSILFVLPGPLRSSVSSPACFPLHILT